MDVVGVGKIEDIFAGKGLTRSIHTHDNEEGIRITIEELKRSYSGMIFTNLVDFDSMFGHRRDVAGFARALEEFDRAIPAILQAMRVEDTLIITADHGNDPTFHGTDHTRELVPVVALRRGITAGMDLGVRASFSDVAETIASLLGVPGTGKGQSFAFL
jgi:phosphopentomutase